MTKIVKNKTARKIGLIYSISILIGTVVGVGIFLKNGAVFEINKGNYISILVAWSLAAVICLATAWSFGEVGSCTSKKGGVGYWIKKLLSQKFGKFVVIIQPFFYYTMISSCISLFASETFFRIFDFNSSIHVAAVIGLGIFIFFFFSIVNFLAFNFSKKMQLILSSLKIVPILIVVCLGIIYAVLQPSESILGGNNVSSTNSSFSFVSIIISLPSILFAFDSFTGVGNLSSDIKNPKRNVPLTIIIGMTMVVIVYLLVTISLMFTGSGNALNIFNNATFLTQNGKKILNILFALFLFISIIGVVNGFCSITMSSWQSLIDDKLIFKAEKIEKFVDEKIFKNKKFKYQTGFFLNSIFALVFIIAIGIPSIIKNTDAYIDGFSNFPTTLFFGIYGIAIVGGVINRIRKKVEVQKIPAFYFTAPIAIVGCLFVLLFQIVYTFSFRNINDSLLSADWGLFYSKGQVVYVWEASIFFWSYIICISICYLINTLLIKKERDKKNKVKKPEEIIWDAFYIEDIELSTYNKVIDSFLKNERRLL